MSEAIEKGNAGVDLDNLPPETDTQKITQQDDFFDQLDRQVMGSALSEPSESHPEQQPEITSPEGRKGIVILLVKQNDLTLV